MAIDYVVPMVFEDDPLWRADFPRVSSRYDESDPYEFVRYRSWGTEELLIRCVRKFMPFVRTIYIILARESQKKAWMDEAGVRVVYHREFIPERFLPTFNSRTMEMFLKDIPGISELFLYGNDDMFPVAQLTEDDFFIDGVPCLHHTLKPFPEQPNGFHRAALGGLNFIAEEFGEHYERSWLKGGHSITPMVRKTWELLWERYGKDIAASITPFRAHRNFNQWLCPWWHHFSGNYVDKVPDLVYVSVKNSVDEVIAAVRNCRGIVCVNDNECEKDYMRYAKAVRKALCERLKD